MCVRLRRQVTFQALASCYTMGPTQTRMSRFFNSFILTFLYSIISTIVFFRRQSAEIGAGRRGSNGNITNTSGPVGTRPSPNNNMDAPSAGPSGTMHNHVYPVKQSNFCFQKTEEWPDHRLHRLRLLHRRHRCPATTRRPSESIQRCDYLIITNCTEF